MIKKLIGIVTAAAVIVVIVFATLHRDRYRSMLFGTEKTPAAEQRAVPADAVVPAADALSERSSVDSISVAAADSAAFDPAAADSQTRVLAPPAAGVTAVDPVP